MGVITAAWAGLFASFFGSSNYNIVGPTGALSGLLANYAQMYLYSRKYSLKKVLIHIYIWSRCTTLPRSLVWFDFFTHIRPQMAEVRTFNRAYWYILTHIF